MNTPLHQKTIAEHARALRSGAYSSVELTQHFLQRIHHAAELNAFISVSDEVALAQARHADQRIAKENVKKNAEGNAESALLGIPLAHKDLFCTEGVLTSCGSKMLANFISPYDATVVQKLKQHGMVMLGKTNMDEFAMGSSNETSHYGVVKNPWNLRTVPGGSSGGAAAAMAAQLAAVATGTDTGGSIRQPAAFCGLTGIKPSYGRVSRYGMIAFASSLDQGGVLARNAEDAALVLRAMSGFDAKDSTSLQEDIPNYPALLDTAIAGKTIGLPKQFFADGADDGVHDDVAQAVEQALAQLRAMGAKTVAVDLPNSEVGIPCYYVLAPAEASSNLARFDGVRYGYRAADYADLTDMYEKTRAEGFGAEVKRRIMIGTFVLSSGYYDAYYLKAQKLRRLIADDFTRAFEQCDLIAGPTTPETAFDIGAKSGDPVAMYLNDIFTNAANLAGLPALSIPVGFDRAGLPIGMQLIGRYLDEASLLNVAHQYQRETDWHLQTPVDYR